MVIESLLFRLVRKAFTMMRKAVVRKDLVRLRQHKDECLLKNKKGYFLTTEDLGITHKVQGIESRSEVCLGEFDMDGFLLSRIGSIEGIPTIAENDFLERDKFGVFLLLKNGRVCVKKGYNGNKTAFHQELVSLCLANEIGCNVPAIVDVNFEALTITMSFIWGSVLREELASAGARIRDSQVGCNEEQGYFTRREFARQRRMDGKQYLSQVIGKCFIDSLEEQFERLYSNGIVNHDIKYGNIIIERRTKMPFLIDFESCLIFRNPSSSLCKSFANKDRAIFESHFR